MSNANEISVVYKIGDNEIKLTPSIVQNYLVGSNTDITMPEFKMFTELCKVQKLNPFLKEAYCIKYGSEPATIVVSKDVVVKRAVNHPMYDGKETGVIVEDTNGNTKERIGCFVAPSENVIGGWAKVYRKDRTHPEYMSVAVAEVANKKKDGTYNSNWSNKTATMVEKVAKVRALREAFVDELQGMYVSDEFDLEHSSEDVKPNAQPIDVDFEDISDEETIKLDDIC